MFQRRPYQPNGPDLVHRYYYVACNHPEASDDNPGTERLPFLTIGRAAAVADMYDVILIDEGVYREEVDLVHNGHAYHPEGKIRFQALPGKKVYLRGSDPFEPEWEHLGGRVYKAPLPDSLFRKGAYNPYALSAALDDTEPVRPIHDSTLPETLGQIYDEARALEQLDSLEAVLATPDAFIVPGEGRHVIVHFSDARPPERRFIELTMRERCIKPMFEGVAYVETRGIVIEHAAAPGPLCYGRPLALRRNASAGIAVRRTYAFASTVNSCANILCPAYVSTESETMVAAMVDDLGRGPQRDAHILTVVSHDAGRSWHPTGEVRSLAEQSAPLYFLDPHRNALVRQFRRYAQYDPDGAFGPGEHETVCQVSHDAGETWSQAQTLDSASYGFRMLPLADGRILWPRSINTARGAGVHHATQLAWGVWRDDGGLDWQDAGRIEVEPERSRCGLAEPHLVALPDGRLFAILRAGNVRPTQDSPGVPSVKLWSVSSDEGATWSRPEPLLYDDGKMVYSARNMPDILRSESNGRVYLLLNIAGASAENCDPRNVLHIGELDPQSCRLKRDSVGIVEAAHPEHHRLVRYSNWASIQDRATGHLLVFLKLALSELCPVRSGYDYRYYRYDLNLPGAEPAGYEEDARG